MNALGGVEGSAGQDVLPAESVDYASGKCNALESKTFLSCACFFFLRDAAQLFLSRLPLRRNSQLLHTSNRRASVFEHKTHILGVFVLTAVHRALLNMQADP